MEYSFGIATFVCAVGFPLLYLLLGRPWQHFAAWVDREQKPKQRAGAYVVILAVLGFAAGSFAQPVVDAGVACHQKGQAIVPCVALGSLYHPQKNPTPITIPQASTKGSSNYR